MTRPQDATQPGDITRVTSAADSAARILKEGCCETA